MGDWFNKSKEQKSEIRALLRYQAFVYLFFVVA